MDEATFQKSRILMVDDELSNIRLLERQLQRWGCTELRSTLDAREVMPLFAEFQPDLILLDLMMPHLDGFAVMDLLKEVVPPTSYLPILVLTADVTPQTRRRALAGGAKEFLTKPFDASELFLRVWNLLETRWLHLQLQEQNESLEQRVQERTRELEDSKRELEKSQIEVLERLARAAEYRDDDTGLHTQRVSHTCALLAQKMELDAAHVELIRHTSHLHDVGKIGIPDDILLKPGGLNPMEFELIKTHTTIGASLLSGGRTPAMKMAQHIALSHHERWDGSGYPQGIAREEIPLEGRILAVADVFDALTHDRPYKRAWSIEQAITEIQSQSGKQFDPSIVTAFLSLEHENLI